MAQRARAAERGGSDFEQLFTADQESGKERGPVFKFRKEVKIKNGEKEIREFVSVAGVELEVNTEGRGTQFTAVEFADFALDAKSLELLKIYAKAIKLNQPPLVEGPTDIGKSKALEYLAFLTNNHLLYQSFSGQTDVSELIGKYVPNTEDARKTFEKILAAKNRGALKPESLQILATAAKKGDSLSVEQCQQIAQNEGLSFDRVEWVWQDGTVPKAMEFNGGRGCWLYFDELGAAEPQILVKLNRIFARGVRRIEITENGGKEVEAGDSFRLIATTNPPNYAGREPFEKDFIRRWVYQKVGGLSQEDFLKRLDHTGHGQVEKQATGAAVELDSLPELDHILNEAIALFRFQAQAYLEKLPRDAGEQEFRMADFTDALRVQEYLRQLQGDDLLETLKEAIEFYYLGKIDDEKKDAAGKNVKEKLREILNLIITQKKVKENIKAELDKLADPEIVKKQREFVAKLKEMEVKEASLRALSGIPATPEPRTPTSTPDTLTSTTPEGREVSIDLKKELIYWTKFYQEHKIDWVTLPETLSLKPDQITKMQELMSQGFDKLLIIPADLVPEPAIATDPTTKEKTITNPHYTQLHTLLSQGYNTTYQGDNYKEDGGMEGSQDKTTSLRLILTKDVQNLEDDPLFKSTKGKSINDLEKDELTKYTGLSESTYLIYQREYFERTKKHLDEKDWTWLPESPRPLSGRVAGAGWDSGFGRLGFNSVTRVGRSGSLGCRLAGSFELGI